MSVSKEERPGEPLRWLGAEKRLAGWATLCPGNNQSAGKDWSGRTRKGNRYLRRLIVECAHTTD